MIKQIFDEIAAESSTNKKTEILAKYKDNDLLKRVLYLALSKRIKFYIKQIPSYTRLETHTHTLEAALEGLELLSKRSVTGGEAIQHLREILMCCQPDDAYIIERIIDKDPKIGVGRTFVNKVWSKLVEETPYMGAKPFEVALIKKLFEKGRSVYAEVKMDGRYSNAVIRCGDVELESRQGEVTYLEGAKFLSELKRLDDCVLNGELTIAGISRYESNGIIASLVSIGNKILKGEDVKKDIAKLKEKHGYEYQEALDAIQYTVWDCISVDEYFNASSKISYSTRMLDLQDILNFDRKPAERANPLTMVKLIEWKIVHSFEEAMEFFQELLNRGEEGAILKASDGAWKDGKPNWQCKCKLEMDIDLKIVGFNYGTGKNANVISSVNATSSDGLVNTKPTGIDEKTMQYVTENQDKLLNTILEVKCSGLSKDSSGNYSLLHPVFKKLRDDKDTCDSLESIKKIEAMAKGLIN